MWFAFERWIYDWHDGHKLLSDVLVDAGHDVRDSRPVAWTTAQVRRGYNLGQKLFVLLGRTVKKITPITSARSSVSITSTTVDPEALVDVLQLHEHSPIGMQVPSDEKLKPAVVTGRDRFIELVRRIIDENRRNPHRDDRPALRAGQQGSKRRITQSSDVNGTVPSARVNAVVPKLKNLEVSIEQDAHEAMIRDIQFSPDGSLLATSRFVCPATLDSDPS